MNNTLETEVSQDKTHETMSYAGFWVRFAALIIDSIILGAANSAILALVGSGDRRAMGGVSIVLSFLYTTLLESSSKQGTLGKQVMGIRVTDLVGSTITFQTAALRWVMKIVSGIIFLIGYIIAAFTEKKQALHDIVAKTLVVKNSK